MSEAVNIIPGKLVWKHIVSITPQKDDIPNGFKKLIINEKFINIPNFNILALLITDPDFKAYYNSNQERYSSDDEISPDEINSEIVVVDGVLLDGYSRASMLLRYGTLTTNAYVNSKKDYNGKDYFSEGGTMKIEKRYTDLSEMKPSMILENGYGIPTEEQEAPAKQKIREVDLVKISDFKFIGPKKVTKSKDSVLIMNQYWDMGKINIQEQVNVLLFNRNNETIGVYQHSKGGLTGSVIDIELITAVAIKSLAKGVIVAHNHPSGNLKPSPQDIQFSKSLKLALGLFTIELLDSLIITPNGEYTSLLDEGLMAKGGNLMGNGGDPSIKEQISMYFSEGSSDKEYHIQLSGSGDEYVVNFQYGRRGNALNYGSKTPFPVPLVQAQKIYNAVKREKLGKGYIAEEGEPSGGAQPGQPQPAKPAEVILLPQLLNVIESIEEYIDDDNYLAQEKKDGERRMVIATDSVIGTNKKGTQVVLPLRISSSVKIACTLDGEAIGDKLYVWDMLHLGGEDYTEFACEDRITLLQTLSFGEGIEVVETAYTKEEKQSLFEKLQRENKEGIVFKLKSSPYVAGRPSSGGPQLKFKFYKTATFIVANSTPGKRSVGLEMIDDEGSMIFMGKVTIPPNKEIPNIGEFVEVRYLYAYKGGAVYQPVYLGTRPDSDMSDINIKQIVHKAEYAEGGNIFPQFDSSYKEGSMKQVNICLDRALSGEKPLMHKYRAFIHTNRLFLYHYQHLLLVFNLIEKKSEFTWYETPTDKRGLNAALTYLGLTKV